MNIGIDARLINETGVGRYIRNLIKELQILDKDNHFFVYLTSEAYSSFTCHNSRWEKRRADVHWHTVKEQIVMPFYFLQDHLDIVHVPYFNAPILYPKPFILTIHDLTVLHVNTGKATTLPYPLYLLRRLGYYLILSIGLSRAKTVIAVSQATKKEICDHFHTKKEKIVVTYEGVDAELLHVEAHKKEGSPINAPYVLYVGNAYPHKNLELLVRAFVRFQEKYPSYKLILVGKDDFFYKRLKLFVDQIDAKGCISFFGATNDSMLRALYSHADAFVFPSLMEGFGLPALEAVALGCPLIVSDIPVFHELLSDLPQYVNPLKEEEIIDALINIVKKNVVPYKKKDVDTFLQKYSWKHMGQQTLALYERI